MTMSIDRCKSYSLKAEVQDNFFKQKSIAEVLTCEEADKNTPKYT